MVVCRLSMLSDGRINEMPRIAVAGVAAVPLLALLVAAPAAFAADPQIMNVEQIRNSLSRPRTVNQEVGVDLPAVTFEFNSARLTPLGRRQLDELAAALADPAFQDLPLEIAGHTDASGSEPYNLRLSEKRALAARKYLLSKGGVTAEKVRTAGYGESKLKRELPPAAPEQRRIEIKLTPVSPGG